jgi:hypothetical protein
MTAICSGAFCACPTAEKTPAGTADNRSTRANTNAVTFADVLRKNLMMSSEVFIYIVLKTF